MQNLEFTELFIVDQTVKVGVDALRVRAHECKELGNHIFSLPLDCHLLWENKF